METHSGHSVVRLHRRYYTARLRYFMPLQYYSSMYDNMNHHVPSLQCVIVVYEPTDDTVRSIPDIEKAIAL